MRGLRECCYVRNWSACQDHYNDALVIDVLLWNGCPVQYMLTNLEVIEGTSFQAWMQTVERDIVNNVDQMIGGLPNQQWPAQQAAQQSQLAHQQQYALQQAQQQQQQCYWQPNNYPDPEVEARAADLFLMVCGNEAFETLGSGKPLPITGSKGTKYTLHKRASYCVERGSDNAKLCAVVPGVPLWDHLLGIKLMIEHDEPKFLKTANVANNYSSQQMLNTLVNAGSSSLGMRSIGSRNFLLSDEDYR